MKTLRATRDRHNLPYGILTKLFLDNLKDFLLIKFLWEALNSGQGFAAISLYQ